MGVSGCGKTTVGRKLAESRGLPFYDADDFHPISNIEKMKAGRPLNDDDRSGWLKTLSVSLEEWQNDGGAVLACSALKETYRKVLNSRIQKIHWIYLKGSFELITGRLEQRQEHYMPLSLLESQFKALEEPTYGYHPDISHSPEELVALINTYLTQTMNDIGVYGLGVMGSNLSLNFADKGWKVAVHNRMSPEEAHLLINFQRQNQERDNVNAYEDLKQFVASLASPRKIVLMIKAGKAIDHVLNDLIPLLSEGDIIIDGGNSFHWDTVSRIDLCRSRGIGFLGVGISGGAEGARKGPSMMPGGSEEAYEKVATILESAAAKDPLGRSCCGYVGQGGSGHFVKMVHNGIEYVEMQLLTEVFDLLSIGRDREEVSSILEEWNQGNLRSYLLEITIEILRKKDEHGYLLDRILDKAGNKGTGSWSSISGLELGVPITMMTSAVFQRYISSFKSLRNQLAQDRITDEMISINEDKIKRAYETARWINHIQGFQLVQAASVEFGWNIQLSGLAAIWSEGCIIKSQLLAELERLLKGGSELILNTLVNERLVSSEFDLKHVLQESLQHSVPVPCLQTAYQYWISISSAELSAHLIQAQRDYFGAHGFELRSDPAKGLQHFEWLK